MKTKKRPFTTIELVVGLLIRQGRMEMEVLMGRKLNGEGIAGYMTGPGGKPKPGDQDMLASCKREIREETKLRADGGEVVGRLHAIMLEARVKKIVHFIRYDEWEGRLQACPREFESLEFIPFSEIPWDEFPPGEQVWARQMITQGKRKLAVITCGKDRKDWISTRLYPLSS